MKKVTAEQVMRVVLELELMAITGLSAQELVRLARSAFVAAGGEATKIVSTQRAVALGIFSNDGTGDGIGLAVIGGEKMARELMAITGLSAQALVRLARAAFGAAGGRGGRDRTASNIAEAVMGSEAWNTYKNTEYKSMHGPRKPQGSAACEKRTKARRSKLGGLLAGWTLKNEPEHFAGTDTRWTMDQTLTWLSPDTCISTKHLETLGNMISEAFHQHKKRTRDDANKALKTSSTAAEATDWNGVTSVYGTDFFKPKT